MGGILVRAYLQDNQIEQLGRIVMLSPPNHGSEVVDRMQDWWLFEKLTGPAGQQLGTGADGVTASLAPIPGEIGIIMGNRTVDPWLSWMIPGRDDGNCFRGHVNRVIDCVARDLLESVAQPGVAGGYFRLQLFRIAGWRR